MASADLCAPDIMAAAVTKGRHNGKFIAKCDRKSTIQRGMINATTWKCITLLTMGCVLCLSRQPSLLFTSAFTISSPTATISTRQTQSKYSSQFNSLQSSSSSETEATATATATSTEASKGAPAWMKCINAVSPRTGALNEAVSRIAGLSLEESNELILMGAVWARFDEETTYKNSLNEWGYNTEKSMYHDRDYVDAADDDSEAEDDLEEYVARLEYESRYVRLMEPQIVNAGTDLRIYPTPRRFPACYQITQERLLYEDTTFVVVDKPPMLPTQPDASNYLECCPGCVNDLLGPFTTLEGEPVRRPLLCHRVDSCVGGCVVLSKDKNGQKVFSEYQRQRKLKKMYLTLTTNPVPLGQHVHWMFAPTNTRGNMSGPSCQLLSHAAPVNRKAAKAWIRCILEVTKSEPIRISPNLDIDDDNDDGTYYQSTVRLVTGRKHQVRAQLASLGAPIVNDSLYRPIAGMTLDRLEVDVGDAEDVMDEAVQQCRIPTKPIGLQAHAILFGGIKAKARPPWWTD